MPAVVQRRLRPIDWIRDRAQTLTIERLSFRRQWESGDFFRFLNRSSSVGYVATAADKVIGYALGELFTRRLQLVRLAVHPLYHHCGVGTTLVKQLCTGLRGERDRVLAEVPEENLPAQKLLQRCEFTAVSLIANYFGLGRDAVQFEFRSEPRPAAALDHFCFRRSL